MSSHSTNSSFREKTLEHVFVAECLRCLWRQGIRDAEVLRADVDGAGYDIVIEASRGNEDSGIMRHIQLKSSFDGAKTARQNVHRSLAAKPSGCVVWMIFDEVSMTINQFLWFGSTPGKALPSLQGLNNAKHTKGDAQGVKAIRPNIFVVPKAKFTSIDSIEKLTNVLFFER